MADFPDIVILTGSGLSAKSGITTFRDRDGIWAKYDSNEVATPEGFRRKQQLEAYEDGDARRNGNGCAGSN